MFFSVTYEKSETARPVLECTGFNRIPLVNETMIKETVAHINGKALGQKLSAIPNRVNSYFALLEIVIRTFVFVSKSNLNSVVKHGFLVS